MKTFLISTPDETDADAESKERGAHASNGEKQILNIDQLRSASRFMFADDESHKTMINMLLASETIKGNADLDFAISMVLMNQASARYEYAAADIQQAVGYEGKYSAWLAEAENTHEKAWALIVADYEKQQADTEPATAQNGDTNPFDETMKAKAAEPARKAKSPRKQKVDMDAAPEDEPAEPAPKD